MNNLKEFNNIQIYNFTSIFNNNEIVVICDESIQKLNKDLVVLQSIKHDIEMNCKYYFYVTSLFQYKITK